MGWEKKESTIFHDLTIQSSALHVFEYKTEKSIEK